MVTSRKPRDDARENVRASLTQTSGPVLRQVNVRQSAHGRRSLGSGARRGTLVAGGVGLLVLGVLIGVFGGHVVWTTPTLSSAAKAQAAIERETNPLFLEAYALQKQGKFGDAQSDYLEIIKINPVNYYAYYDLALIYQETNHPDAATVDYEKALLIDPTYQPALYNLATLESTSSPTSAIDLYTQLQALQPKNADAVAFNLGLLYLKVGNTKQGIAELKYAISLTPSLLNRLPSADRALVSGPTGSAG